MSPCLRFVNGLSFIFNRYPASRFGKDVHNITFLLRIATKSFLERNSSGMVCLKSPRGKFRDSKKGLDSVLFASLYLCSVPQVTGT